MGAFNFVSREDFKMLNFQEACIQKILSCQKILNVVINLLSNSDRVIG